ncbi:hypothetical protein ACFE04_005522 [Oxalis oulophora]
MLRASNLPLTVTLSSSSPALSVLRRSSIPTLTLLVSSSSSSFLHLHKAAFHTFLLPIPNSSHFLHKWAPSTILTPRPPPPTSLMAASASFSAQASNAGGAADRQILVQHLLLKQDDHQLLADLQKLLAAGDDLSDLAVEYSICPSKEQGGSLGWVSKGQMVPEFEEAAFNAPLNKVVRCKTKFGWHLLQVLSEREEARLQEIQPEEFHSRIQDPNFLEESQLIDVREPDEIDQASLPNFQVYPLRQFGSWGPEIITKFDPEKDTYVMCHHGMRSLQVAKWLQTQYFYSVYLLASDIILKLRAQGFRKVYNLTGGIHAYAVKVDSSIPTY